MLVNLVTWAVLYVAMLLTNILLFMSPNSNVSSKYTVCYKGLIFLKYFWNPEVQL